MLEIKISSSSKYNRACVFNEWESFVHFARSLRSVCTHDDDEGGSCSSSGGGGGGNDDDDDDVGDEQTTLPGIARVQIEHML